MKNNEIVVGQEYETKVGEQRVIVRVVAKVEQVRHGGLFSSERTLTKFRCVRVDNGRELPKSRSGAALHPVRGAR